MMIVSLADDRRTPLATRVSRAELVAQEIEREITEHYRPGDRLGTKDQLRRRFGVAAATVNEAIRLLETHGLVRARPGPGGGVFVSAPEARLTHKHTVLGFKSGVTSYEDCLEVRDALEPAIDRHAARHHTSADIGALRAVLDEMSAAVDDPPRFFAGNWALHRRIGMLCGNAPLRAMYLSLVDFLEALLELHRDLVDAIEAGEGPHLEAATEAHRPTQARRDLRIT
jgi:DNA-binding FadR family transcriptional regulator